MAFVITTASAATFLLLLHLCVGYPKGSPGWPPMSKCNLIYDHELMAFPLNLEYLEAEFFLCGAFGYGLDHEARQIAMNGPRPIGCTKANLGKYVLDNIKQMAYQEVGHLRAIQGTLQNNTGKPGFPRPQLDLSSSVFANIMDNAFGETLDPPFNPYQNDINYLIASYAIPYVGLTGYVGALPCLFNPTYRKLVGGLLAVESGQDAVIREMLYERADQLVKPYRFKVSEFTSKISSLRDNLGGQGVKDEGIVVDKSQGAEGKIAGNVLAGNENSVAYDRTPEEILAIVYGSGDVHKPGGFLPNGGGGAIAESYLRKH
ncbi:Unknown protein [Striga hermonthica]|uniref:Desiccation-related protein PCC13-62 n=1 Tax=Striga hermonthica TaxID=68872 RepID=A0A9N7NGX4_STRHE|nr:Unknown protein [Striga hermonthica]